MEPSIRVATVADAAAIARIHVVAWQVAYQGLLPDAVLDNLSVPKRAGNWVKHLAVADGRHFVLEHDGAIVGWATIGTCRDDGQPTGTGELCAMYLDPAHWRRGGGRRLFAHVEQALRDRGCTGFTLWVMAQNRPARAFYEKMGMRADGAEKRDACDGAVVDQVRYRKALG